MKQPAPKHPSATARKQGPLRWIMTTVVLSFVVGVPVKCVRMLREKEEKSSALRVEPVVRREVPVPLERTAGREIPFPLTGPMSRPARAAPENRHGLEGRVRAGRRYAPPGVGVVLALEGGGGMRTHTGRDGRFAFADLPPGTHALSVAVVATLTGETPAPLPVSRGLQDVTFRLPTQGTLALRCGIPERMVGDLDVWIASKDGTQRAHGAWPSRDSGALVLGATAGRTYDLCIRHAGSGLAALVQDLPFDGVAFVPLTTAAEVAGRVRIPSGMRGWDVKAELVHEGLRIPVPVPESGSFEIRAMPGGTRWTVHAAALTEEGIWLKGSADIVVGLTPPPLVTLD